MLLCNGLALAIRLVIQKQLTFSFLFACIFPLVWTVFLYLFISNSGTPKRDIQGNLISPGSDLNQAGLIEWSWDVLYITWFCQIGSSILGERFWWLLSVIPCYAIYKAWSMIAPFLFNNSGRGPSQESNEPKESRRQEKSRKRQTKGLQ